MWRAVIEYLRNLTMGTSKESSKRFIALYVGVILISYIVLRFTNATNIEMILGELVAFVCVLLGVAAWENNKSRVLKDKTPKEDEPE